jgi:branched-chain amino acid transport system ATP-binding protein
MSDDPLLSLKGINVFYGVSQILFDVGLTMEKGQTMALLGRNGAGKSTTFKSIIGIAPPRTGTIAYAGHNIAGYSPTKIARAGIGYVPEDRQVFPEHTVEDNLRIGAKAGPTGSRDWTLERIYDLFPILAERRARYAGKMSGGEQQMLTIARTLMGNPDLLLLDEPSEGLAPIIVQRIGELIRDLRSRGVSILMAEQNMHFCLGVATHATVIDKGSIRFSGTIESLRENDEVQSRYLSV